MLASPLAHKGRIVLLLVLPMQRNASHVLLDTIAIWLLSVDQLLSALLGTTAHRVLLSVLLWMGSLVIYVLQVIIVKLEQLFLVLVRLAHIRVFSAILVLLTAVHVPLVLLAQQLALQLRINNAILDSIAQVVMQPRLLFVHKASIVQLVLLQAFHVMQAPIRIAQDNPLAIHVHKATIAS